MANLELLLLSVMTHCSMPDTVCPADILLATNDWLADPLTHDGLVADVGFQSVTDQAYEYEPLPPVTVKVTTSVCTEPE